MIENEEQLTKDLSGVVVDKLGPMDEAHMLAKFIISLYKNAANGSDSETSFEKFKKNIVENGGSSFTEGFISESYEVIRNYSSKSSKNGLFKEKESKAEDCYTGLSIPNVSVSEINKLYDDDIKTNRAQRSEYMGSETSLSGSHKGIQPGCIYRGVVYNITKFGAFIKIQHLSGNQDVGLCHISQISFDSKVRIRHPSDVLQVGQNVFVKVIDIHEATGRHKKISLTMKRIDQSTGLEIENQTKYTDERNQNRFERGSIKNFNKRRLTSPERWELQKLMSSGAISREKYEELAGDDFSNDDFASRQAEENDINDMLIELKSEEPSFLKGSKIENIQLAPTRIIRNPEGSLNKAAMNGSKLVRTIKEEQQRVQKELQKNLRLEREKNAELKISNSSLLNESVGAEYDETTKNFISGWKKSQSKQKVSYGKRTNLTLKEQRESLPVFSLREEIIRKVDENQFLIVVGETGSGKTTQIVQYLSEAGYNDVNGTLKMIGCTQPRRVAAVSVAKRVSEEMGCVLGREVGYNIRFEDLTSSHTKIKYMTDGMLQREALIDPLMKKYSVIMLDEAHERTISTDVMFVLLKKAAESNPNLKIIVTSATLDAQKFSLYFHSCPILTIPGRTFPVEILYSKEPEMDYLAAALDTVMQIHVSEPEGDILVFLTGQEEIDVSCDILYERVKALKAVSDLIILPVYSSLPSEIQSRIFEPTPPGTRKAILATNIAETSITIDGIYYVVDPGFVKVNVYDPKLGMDSLKITPISQAQAKQRSGRAGRTGPGKCYRLYTEAMFHNEMLKTSVADIQRQNLSNTVLMLKAMGINDLLNFDFMDPPSKPSMLSALHDLYALSALDDNGQLTALGKKMTEFPMEPALAKTLIISSDMGCSEEVLTVVAMLSVQTIFYRPKDKQKEADQKKYRFHNSFGDHLTLLNVYKSWELNNYDKKWCQDNYIQDRSMRKAREVRRQLLRIMTKSRQEILSCGSDLSKVRKSFCAGYFKRSAKRDPSDGYKTLSEQVPVSIHPSSALFGKSPEYVIYHNLLFTSKEYMNCVSIIDPKWLVEVAPSYFQVGDQNSSRRAGQKIIPLHDKFSKDQDAWRLSSQISNKRRALNNSST